MKFKSYLAAAALVSAAALAQNASAAVNIVVNGGFEAASVDPAGNFTTLFGGSTAITGWTVGPDSVDYIGGYWQASEGARSVDLSGNQPGSIAQTIATVAGKYYKVTFDLAGNPDAGPVLKAMAASSAGPVQNFSFNTTGASHGNMNWTPSSFIFKATSNSTTLSFASLTGDAYGPALDNVAASVVPEPATWAMMIIGFGAVGSMARSSRRRQALAAV